MKTKKNLLGILGIALPLAVALGCGNKDEQYLKYLNKPVGNKEIIVEKNDSYIKYMRKLANDCPEFNDAVKNLDSGEVWEFLRNYNVKNGGDRDLKYNTRAYLPDYPDCE